MTLIYPIASAVICAIIEAARIFVSYGHRYNVNKVWTYTIGISFFGLSLAFSVGYYDEIWPLDVMCYMIYYASVRGVIYDPLLNVLRGLPVDYKSKTTNSKIDRVIGNRVQFWVLRIIYLAIAIISGFIWITLLRKAQGIY